MAVKALILVDSFQYAENLHATTPWDSLGMELMGIEYNGALGIEQFRTFQPEIVVLDALLPIIGVDKFIQSLQEYSSDFLVILLDDTAVSTSNIQHVYRTLPKTGLTGEVLAQTLTQAVDLLIKRRTSRTDTVPDTGRFARMTETFGDGAFSLEQLQTQYEELNLALSPHVQILLPRPMGEMEGDLPQLLPEIKPILDSHSGGEVLVMRNGVLCILINEITGSPDLSPESVYNHLFYELRWTLEQRCGTRFTFFFSDLVELRQLGDEYKTILSHYSLGYFLSGTDFVTKKHMDIFLSGSNRPTGFQGVEPFLSALLEPGSLPSLNARLADLYGELKAALDMELLWQWRRNLELVYYTATCLANLNGGPCPFDLPYPSIELERDGVADWFGQLHPEVGQCLRPMNPLVLRAVVKVLDHFNQDISLKWLADQISVTTTYLSHLFKKELGVNFTVFLTDIRILVAKRLIGHTGKKVHEIATEAGFWDYRYFSHVFRKNTGMTPTAYRGLIQSRSVNERMEGTHENSAHRTPQRA